MNYYALETQMFEKQREMQREAAMRRLVAASRERPETPSDSRPRVGFLTAIAGAFRRKVTVGDAS
jgi:hypothetical protein